jgi:hypothetical protein
MVRELIGLWGAAAERCLRGWLLGVVTATVAALFAVVSLGFATFAAYIQLRASTRTVVAALIVCTAYGLLAIAIWAVGVARSRATQSRRAAASVLASAGSNVDSLREWRAPDEARKARGTGAALSR